MTERILVALAGGRRLSKWHLAREVSAHPTYVTEMLGRLKARGLVRIARWEHVRYEQGFPSPIWVLGGGQDALRSGPKDDPKRHVKYRRRLRAERPEEYERQLAAKRHKGRESRRKPTLDPILAALHGRA